MFENFAGNNVSNMVRNPCSSVCTLISVVIFTQMLESMCTELEVININMSRHLYNRVEICWELFIYHIHSRSQT